MEHKYKSRVRIYVFVWLAILSFCISMKYIFHSSEDYSFAYMILIGIPAIVVNAIEGRILMNYVRDHYDEDYRRIKSLGNMQGVHNGFAAFGFIFSSDTKNDETLKGLKENYKRWILLILLIFISYPVVFLLL